MKKIILLAILLLPLLFLALRPSASSVVSSPASTTPLAGLPTKPWITVSKPDVSVLDTDGNKLRTLADGDSLDYPITLSVSSGGEAKIHFLDGSVLRLDSGTTMTLNDGSYSQTDGTLLVKVSLAVGRVWSKVVELATPASTWEVKTSNAVATVRGTAFGVDTDGNHSRLFGSQHKVEVQALDPKTGERVGKAPAVLDEGKMIELSNNDVADIQSNKKTMAAVDVSAAVMTKDEGSWMQANQTEDVKVETQIQDLKSHGMEGMKMRQELLKQSVEEFHTELKVEKAGIKAENQNVKPAETDKPVSSPKIELNVKTEPVTAKPVNKVDLPAAQATIRSSDATPVSLAIQPGSSLDGLKEETPVAFKATLSYSDGHKEDVTSQVDWKVLGPIGSINTRGIFTGKLAREISETGEGSGVVIAVWRGGGKELPAQSPIFKVELKLDDTVDQRG